MSNIIIYKGTSISTGKVYIGQTTRGLEKRSLGHKWSKNKERNEKHEMYYDMRMYGYDDFLWEIIEKVEKTEDLNSREIHWIEHYKSELYELYNMTDGGAGSVGFKHTEESLKKMRGRTFVNPSRGENHPFAKLSSADVEQIVTMSKQGKSTLEIGERFGVTDSNIQYILSGQTWSDISKGAFQIKVLRYTMKDFDKEERYFTLLNRRGDIIKGGGSPYYKIVVTSDQLRDAVEKTLQSEEWASIAASELSPNYIVAKRVVTSFLREHFFEYGVERAKSE